MLDWRNPKDYAYIESLSNSRWAWEFLRRNPKYRDDWQRFSGSKDFEGPFITDDDYDRLFQVVRALRHWGLATLYDPATKGTEIPDNDYLWRDNLTYYSESLPQDITPREYSENWRLGAKELLTFIKFDLERPIEQQLKSARQEFKMIREVRGIPKMKARTKAHKGRWKTYLRALDGRANRASLTELGEAFFPSSDDPKSDIRSVVNAAEKIRDGGYRDIVALGD